MAKMAEMVDSNQANSTDNLIVSAAITSLSQYSPGPDMRRGADSTPINAYSTISP